MSHKRQQGVAYRILKISEKLIMRGNGGKRRFPERKKFEKFIWNPKSANIFAENDFLQAVSRKSSPLLEDRMRTYPEIINMTPPWSWKSLGNPSHFFGNPNWGVGNHLFRGFWKNTSRKNKQWKYRIKHMVILPVKQIKSQNNERDFFVSKKNMR